MTAIVAKHRTTTHQPKDGAIELFSISIDAHYFGDERLFQEPFYFSHGKRFIALVERRMAAGRASGETRLVIFDRTLKTQWCSAWAAWSIYFDIELRENSDQNLFAKLTNAIRTFLNIQGSVRFSVRRRWRDFAFKEFHLLPFAADETVPWTQLIVPTRLDTQSTQSFVYTTATTVHAGTEPGPVVSTERWSDINRIQIQRTIADDYQWTHLILLGAQSTTVALPCLGASSFIRELIKRYGIHQSDLDEVIEAHTTTEKLLWTSLSSVTDLVHVRDRQPLQQSELQDGFCLQNGQRIGWTESLNNLKNNPIIRKSTHGGAVTYETTQPVVIGSWLIPKLFCYEVAVEDPAWPPQNWNFEFLDFSPVMSGEEIYSMVKSLTNRDIYFDPEFSHIHLFGEHVNFSLSRRTGTWSGGIEISYPRYWSMMRATHAITKTLVVDRCQSFSASTSTVGIGNFDAQRLKHPNKIPTPAGQEQFPLSFWEDSAKNLQGVASYVHSYLWNRGEVFDVAVRRDGYQGDRGEAIEFSILTLRFKDGGELDLTFGAIELFDATAIKAWLDGDGNND
jgi:hypothetical protein